MRLLDEVIDLGALGAVLFCAEGQPQSGLKLRDARGNVHIVSSVTKEDDLYTLHIADGDAAYFERLFRDVRIDATRFEEVV
ncbi:MAG: hypothetical protein IJ354_02940 [Clostridia bacterium]|nr:hypothetical protein [Clostridia bacterium]